MTARRDRERTSRRALVSAALLALCASVLFVSGGALSGCADTATETATEVGPRVTEAQVGVYLVRTFDGLPIPFVRLPAGRFEMGSPTGAPGTTPREWPRHGVVFSRPLLVGRTEVTWEQWAHVLGWEEPPKPERLALPVGGVTWSEAVAFCNALSAIDEEPFAYDARGNLVPGTTGYRLPTEAEWEYAATSGGVEPAPANLSAAGWYADNSGRVARPVATLQPNAAGLNDMLGNVWEWTSDWFDRYWEGEFPDPVGPVAGTQRVIRGGCYAGEAESLRATHRSLLPPQTRLDYVGLRVVQSVAAAP